MTHVLVIKIPLTVIMQTFMNKPENTNEGIVECAVHTDLCMQYLTVIKK